MDFKGIAWAGNIYEKFEAMCLEVEEVIHEDTVKYMENQVQKVSASVKKFYSEVMQDFLPPSCIDPVKEAATDLSLNHYSHADNHKKPKLCTLESQEGVLKKKETSNEDNCGFTSKETSSNGQDGTNSQLPQSCTVIVESTGSAACSAKSKKLGAYKRPIGIKRISQATCSPRKSGPTSMVVCKLTRGCDVALNNMNVTRSSVSSPECDPKELETQLTSPGSSKVLSVEFLRQDKDNPECTSSVHDKLMQDGSCSQIHQENICSGTCGVESTDEEVFISYEDSFDMELIDNEEIAESGSEVYLPFEKSQLDDTCVLVKGDMLPHVSQAARKQKSYKKKFREALAAKFRPPRKQNQSICQHKDLFGKDNADVVTPDLTIISDCRNAPAKDSFGSDWELI